MTGRSFSAITTSLSRSRSLCRTTPTHTTAGLGVHGSGLCREPRQNLDRHAGRTPASGRGRCVDTLRPVEPLPGNSPPTDDNGNRGYERRYLHVMIAVNSEGELVEYWPQHDQLFDVRAGADPQNQNEPLRLREAYLGRRRQSPPDPQVHLRRGAGTHAWRAGRVRTRPNNFSRRRTSRGYRTGPTSSVTATSEPA